jgi:5-methyltetrahydropteroyltriglutamate--homocysteine methyltransferase
LLPTTIIGSLPKPGWLSESQFSVTGGWKLQGEALREAMDDATLLALRTQEEAGIDIVCDGEQRRGTHYTYFLRDVEGIDCVRLAPKAKRGGTATEDVPCVIGSLRLSRHQAVRDFQFLRRHTGRPIKMTLPGPSTLVDGTADRHYGDERALALAFAGVLNEEIRALEASGCEMVQLDEPVFSRIPRKLAEWGIEALDAAFAGTRIISCVHVCYGYRARLGNKTWTHGYEEILPHLAKCGVQQYSLEYAEPGFAPGFLSQLTGKVVQLGVIDVGTNEVESPDMVAERLRAALTMIPVDRLIAAPDCGMVMLDRVAAARKLRSLVSGAALVRDELQRRN